MALIVWLTLKLTWMLSGKTARVWSFQPPPAPQLLPLCSPSMAPLGGKFALYCEEAVAVEPFVARATFVPQGVGAGVGVGVGVGGGGTTTGVQLKASISTTRL